MECNEMHEKIIFGSIGGIICGNLARREKILCNTNGYRERDAQLD